MDEEKKISRYSLLLTVLSYLFIFSILHFVFLQNSKNIRLNYKNLKLQVSIKPNLKQTLGNEKNDSIDLRRTSNLDMKKNSILIPIKNEGTVLNLAANETFSDISNINSVDKAAELDNYFAAIYQNIKAHEYYPDSERAQEHKGKVKLSFTVLKTGIIEKINIVQKCPYEKLNKAAKETIALSGPFIPIPENIGEEKLTFTIDMEYKI
jgi:TonB family protein